MKAEHSIWSMYPTSFINALSSFIYPTYSIFIGYNFYFYLHA